MSSLRLVASSSSRRARVIDHATFVFGSRRAAEKWLARPAIALNGRRPAELLQSAEGTLLLHDTLTRLEWGVYC
ncbi:DUF2384 domain-containing protein [Dankookia rubra]|uniref:DUF2384 domain-containing protein n=1 Tax=Dankookia rubra TaxID=1442381 RepID=A0A4R5Q6M0_9PROT|nr:DUF2384 domain-containing protein [Dankookia rubra]